MFICQQEIQTVCQQGIIKKFVKMLRFSLFLQKSSKRINKQLYVCCEQKAKVYMKRNWWNSTTGEEKRYRRKRNYRRSAIIQLSNGEKRCFFNVTKYSVLKVHRNALPRNPVPTCGPSALLILVVPQALSLYSSTNFLVADFIP